ncbi:DUF1302 family protein [Aromatoleum anaerobium]|uniref:LysR family transcriptional regulator n=1 Tax=Aromatoleum anaerobium TaxID=182180 RepID=A0ABX1PFP3_9RHOO|nr:DUF1302 family protein [Aromatoleum anaerobium]MCK0509050.1 LysR family transcriptional regulator [Aromatoleum anaerobium]
MKNKEEFGARKRTRLKRLAAAVAIATAGVPAYALDESIRVDGYLRQELSWNTENWVDTPGYDDRGKLSMARTTARLNIDWKATQDVSVVAKLRAVGEFETGFLEHLEKMGANNYHSGARGDIMKLYNRNDIGDVVRELYIDFPLGERTRMRFGKQQIAWGETDFFAANDIVHGFDYTWRTFLEPANEELRKTNIMFKLNIDVPELDGGVEMFLRPGWDRKEDIGTELDIYGGRWSGHPYAGVDFRNIDPYDFDNKEGDYRDPTGGIRWSGLAGDINYSVSYLKTFWPSPIMNGTSKFNGMPGTSPVDTVGRADTTGLFGNVIYPMVDVFGFTGSGYAEWADAVFSTEVAYVKDLPYQISLIPGSFASQVVAPGFDGIERKDVLTWMLRMDKNIAATQSLLGTEKPMFFSLQLFDKWIQNYDRDDRLLNSVGWGARTKEHSFLLTGIFGLSYDNGRVKPELVVGKDLTYGGGFAVPSVTMELAKDWRWKVEYDAFWSDKWRDTRDCAPPNAGLCDDTGLFGVFHKRDQFYTSLTYLF